MKTNKKKLKRLISKAILYTICWRNVDKLDDIWIFDSDYIKLKERRERNGS